jgi:hypothetical protein
MVGPFWKAVAIKVFGIAQERAIIEKQKAAINLKRLMGFAMKRTLFFTPAF